LPIELLIGAVRAQPGVRHPAAAAQPQALPFSVKADGAVLLLVKVPVKPIVTVPPGGIKRS
jgi:hypothetical protein